MKKNFSPRIRAILIWLTTSLALASHAWITDGLSGSGIFTELTNKGFSLWWSDITKDGTLYISLTIYLALSALLYWLTASLFRPVKEKKINREPNSKVMILNVSTPPPNTNLEFNKTFALFTDTSKEINNKLRLGEKSLEHDINKLSEMGFRWNWQQTMRGIEAHQSSVKEIYLLFTKSATQNPRDSYHYEALIVDWLNLYFKNTDVKIKAYTEKYLNSEDLTISYTCYNDVLDELKTKYDESDIVVDITGGNAVMSAAASMSTLHNKVKLQYVNTNTPFDVKFYDISLDIHQQPL